MLKLKPSRKNCESNGTPLYVQIPNSLISPPSNNSHTNSKKRQIQSSLRFDLSKESPFHESVSCESHQRAPQQKSSYNILKDNQEFKIGENPIERSKYFIKTRLPPLEVYNCLTNETKVFDRPEIVKREASGYEDVYHKIFKKNFNAFHKKNGEFEGFLDKSKVISVFGDLTINQRGIIPKESSILPSINKSSNICERSSFLSNSILNSNELSKMNNISTRREVEKNYSFWSLQKNKKEISSKKRNLSRDFILRDSEEILTSEDNPNSKILTDNNIVLEISQKPYNQIQSYNPRLYSEENIDFYGDFEQKLKKFRTQEKERIKNLKIRLEVSKNL